MNVDELLEEVERFSAHMKWIPVSEIEELGRNGDPQPPVCRERARAVLLRRLKAQTATGGRIDKREHRYER